MLTDRPVFNVDLDLVKKYSVPGPRYTSYPPATQFTENFDAVLLEETIARNNQTRRPLSLYVHLPFCRSLCWYCGCTSVITTQQDQSGRYLSYLEKEMDLMARTINPNRSVVQLHYGGGTPTFLLPDELRRLGEMIRSRFALANRLEGGVEIDPRRLTQDHIKALRETGFNRASLGVQDHDADVQRAVHRIQPFEETKQAIDWIRDAGFKSVNIDLIYGLPYQTQTSFERTLDDVIGLEPERFSVFNYAHIPWIKPAQRIFAPEVLPLAEAKLRLLKLTIEKLTSAGYVFIGMDHFARPGDELATAQRDRSLQRNFQGYSTCGDADIYSFGISAISQTPDAYWQNLKELPEYYDALETGRVPVAKCYLLTDDDRIRRQTIMRLMCDLELDFAQLSSAMEIDFANYFATELDSLVDLEADGLVVRSGARLAVTDMGRLLIRNIAMRFDKNLTAQRKDQCYSKTI